MDLSLRAPFNGHYPVTFPFGARPTEESIQNKFKNWGLIGHHGIDFMLPLSTLIYACDDGQVTQTGPNGDFGISVIISHSWGESIYAHLKETKVTINQLVKKGDSLGLSGESGVVSGPHLHFGIKPKDAEINNGYFGFIDPSPFIQYVDEKKENNTQNPQQPATEVDKIVQDLLKNRQNK
ncbi:M23 family metallopeptidase [Candidatus Gottesmanbacteria bacterium]|nr:M23 family metallopeptidase [Candidatus Gottesmanbacteria bacterium]